MEWVWAAIGAIAAVIIIPVTIWAVLRRKRRPVLVLLASETRVGPASTSDRLGMTWDGVPIADPWLVTLTVVNESRDDIASARFDRDRPLVLSLGKAEVKDTLGAPFDGEPWSLPADGSLGAVEFGPDLIPASAWLQIQLVVAGKPALEWRRPRLINVEISHHLTVSATPRLGYSYRRLLIATAAAIGSATAIAGFWSALR